MGALIAILRDAGVTSSDRGRELRRSVAVLAALEAAVGVVLLLRPPGLLLAIALLTLPVAIAVFVARVLAARAVPDALDVPVLDESEKDNPKGAAGADFVALGLGPT